MIDHYRQLAFIMLQCEVILRRDSGGIQAIMRVSPALIASGGGLR
jgi:hypothetical protein